MQTFVSDSIILKNELSASRIDMVLSFSRALDLLHPSISEHHLRVSYAAATMAEAAGLETQDVQDILIAGALHDISAACQLSSHEALDRILSESDADLKHIYVMEKHAREGHRLLAKFPPFAASARIILHHHVDWDHGAGAVRDGQPVKLASHILRLAHQLSLLPPKDQPVTVAITDMREAVHNACHSHFHPEVVALFDVISLRESFWMDLVSPHKERILKKRFQADDVVLNLDELETLAQVFAEVVDYRSAYTARHSIAVGATSRTIAMQLDLPMATQRLVGIAGYLHDIGKLCVSPNILEKPGTLTAEEYRIIRQHPYYTHQILSTIPGFDKIALWAAFHHERLDGKGYPFRPPYLPLEARIVAIADIFVALREDRPYRKGLEVDECLQVLHRLAQDGAIDGKIVNQMSVDAIPIPEEV